MFPCVQNGHKGLGEEIKVRCLEGAVYRFKGILATSGGWVYAPALYRAIGFFTDVRTGNSVVGYEGMEGVDTGKKFMCGLLDWHENFEEVIEVLQEKVAGAHEAGSGF